MPRFEAELLPSYQDQGLHVLAVGVGFEVHGTAQLIDELGVTLPLVLDLESEAFRTYRAARWVFPLSLVIDREGRVVLVDTDGDFDAVEAAIVSAL